MFVVILLLVLWPLVEIAVFLQVISWIGVLNTLAEPNLTDSDKPTNPAPDPSIRGRGPLFLHQPKPARPPEQQPPDRWKVCKSTCQRMEATCTCARRIGGWFGVTRPGSA